MSKLKRLRRRAASALPRCWDGTRYICSLPGQSLVCHASVCRCACRHWHTQELSFWLPPIRNGTIESRAYQDPEGLTASGCVAHTSQFLLPRWYSSTVRNIVLDCQLCSSSIYKHYIRFPEHISQHSRYTTIIIITLMLIEHTELFSPELSAGSLVSVGYSTVWLGVDSDASTTVAIGTGTVVEPPCKVVELMRLVEF